MRRLWTFSWDGMCWHDNDRMVRMSGGKKVVIAFILFFLVTRPTKLADVLHTSLGDLGNGADSVIEFVGSMFSSAGSSVSDEVVVDNGVERSDHSGNR